MSVSELTFGIKTMPVNYVDVLASWQEAETVPEIGQAWLWDHMVPFREPRTAPLMEGWTLLAALASQTRRLRIGVMVTGNPNRLPAILAKIAATVDVISEGRLEFGIGAGGGQNPLALAEYEAYGVPSFPVAESIARLDEALEIIRRIWTEPVVDHEGPHYRLRGTICEPKPVQKPHPPILIGGMGERFMLRVVARHANTWNFAPLDPATALEQFRHKSHVLDEHCAAIGRDPKEVGRQVYMILSPDEPERIREAMRAYVDAGATQIVVALRQPYTPGMWRRFADDVLAPVAQEHGGA